MSSVSFYKVPLSLIKQDDNCPLCQADFLSQETIEVYGDQIVAHGSKNGALHPYHFSCVKEAFEQMRSYRENPEMVNRFLQAIIAKKNSRLLPVEKIFHKVIFGMLDVPVLRSFIAKIVDVPDNPLSPQLVEYLLQLESFPEDIGQLPEELRQWIKENTTSAACFICEERVKPLPPRYEEIPDWPLLTAQKKVEHVATTILSRAPLLLFRDALATFFGVGLSHSMFRREWANLEPPAAMACLLYAIALIKGVDFVVEKILKKDSPAHSAIWPFLAGFLMEAQQDLGRNPKPRGDDTVSSSAMSYTMWLSPLVVSVQSIFQSIKARTLLDLLRLSL